MRRPEPVRIKCRPLLAIQLDISLFGVRASLIISRPRPTAFFRHGYYRGYFGIWGPLFLGMGDGLGRVSALFLQNHANKKHGGGGGGANF